MTELDPDHVAAVDAENQKWIPTDDFEPIWTDEGDRIVGTSGRVSLGFLKGGNEDQKRSDLRLALWQALEYDRRGELDAMLAE